ncbi:MAG: hypothetical protein SGARI_005204, partial [Bacillariaceae sp.]
MALFLLERGYQRSSVDEVVKKTRSKSTVEALQALWNSLGGENDIVADGIDPEELLTMRQEEREVLGAIYGDDIEWFVPLEEGTEATVERTTTLLDSSVPITTYTPPERYMLGDDPPPELRIEIYTSLTSYPLDGSAPILAVLGGGIPQEYLYKLTQQLRHEAVEKAAEEGPGSPLLFTLITHLGEICEAAVEEKGAAAEKRQEEARKAKLKALREQQKAELEAQAKDDDGSSNKPKAPPTKFASEEERRAYAASVLAQTANGLPKKDTIAGSNGKDYNTKDVSNDDLINDLFG